MPAMPEPKERKMTDWPSRDVIDWLLAGDVSIQYAVHRDLLGIERPELRARIATEGWGARYLAARNPDTSWGREFYQPKWTNSHYTLLDLKNLGIDPGNALIRRSIAHILETARKPDGGMGPAKTSDKSDVCVAAMFLNYASYFCMPEDELRSIVDFVLGQKMSDGGFNCDSNIRHPHHSSLHTSVSVLEGFQQFLDQGYVYRAGDLATAIASAREFVLMHRFFRSDRTGEVINPAFLRWPYPFRWKYNVLRALDHFAAAMVPYDPRMREALDHVTAKRRPDGRWQVYAAYPGKQHFVMEEAGEPSRWITLIASRVLRVYCA
jgi:hypothetical protein